MRTDTGAGARARRAMLLTSSWMRSAAGLMLAASLSGMPPVAAAQPPPAPAASPGRLEPYSTADTEIGELIADPQARAILEKYVPGLVRSGQTPRTATLKSIQGYALPLLSDQVLARIDAELAGLGPKPTKPRRVTTNEAKVKPYTLPDPLVLANGRPVRDVRTWRRQRRPEILRLFATLEYGRVPARPVDQWFEVLDPGSPAFGGVAVRKQVAIHISKDPAAPAIQLVEYLPAAAKAPAPMLLMIGFTAPSAMFDDPGVRPGLVWDPATGAKVAAKPSPLGKVDARKWLEAGFAVAAFYYGDLDPDFAGGYPLGVRARYDRTAETQRASDAWGAISAWAWSLSRVQDYLETDPGVDSRRVAIWGASRLGKTVLWAGARDERFAAVIACCSGKLGAGLMRRNFGASIGGDDGGVSDYWTAPAFRQFYGHEEQLPMDGHMLLALLAPRPVLLQTGKYDHAADPKGEYLAAVAAGPVYALYGKRAPVATAWPPQQPVLSDLGYWMNDAGHGVAKGDWDVYLAFLKAHLQPTPRPPADPDHGR